MDEELAFEPTLRGLERTVEELEEGDLGLDEALAKYEQGVRMLARLHGLLDGAERRIALVTGLDEAGRPLTVPFDATATTGSTSGRASGEDDLKTPPF